MSGTLHGRTERGSEILGGRDRQVARPAAAHVGGVAAADPVAAAQQLRRVDRSPDDDRSARRQQPAPRPAARSRAGRTPPRSGCGPRTAASATASQCPPERGSLARIGVAAASDARGRRAYRSARSPAPDARRAAAPRRSATPPTGWRRRSDPRAAPSAARRRRRCRTSGPRRSGSAKWSSAMSSSPVAAASHVGVAGELVQRQQPGRQRRVVLEDGRAVADPAAEAGAPQPAVDDVQVDDRRARIALRRRGIRDRSSATDASASAVIAKPFHAVTTLSSRPGCGRPSRAASSACAHPVEPGGVVGVGAQLQHRGAVLERSGLGDREKLCGPSAVVVTEHLAQLRGRPRVGQTLDARRCRRPATR